VQRRLDRLAYPTGPVDGFFGPITDGAVRRYQRDNGLQVDGIVGPRTLRDLRTRTRRGQGSADREASAGRHDANAQTAVWGGREATSSPKAWTLLPLLAAAFAILLVATGLSLRLLAGRSAGVSGVSRRREAPNGDGRLEQPAFEPEIAIRRPGRGEERGVWLIPDDEEHGLETAAVAEEPELAAVTAIGSRSLRSRPSRLVAASERGGQPGRLRVVRRIEQNPRRSSGRAQRPRTAGRSGSPANHEGDPGRFSLLGARLHLAQDQPAGSRDTLLVHLELFVEGDRRRWETGATEKPFRVSIADLEESVHALVVPGFLPAFSHALGRDGLDIEPEGLAQLRFGIEPSVEVERAMAERGDAFRIAG
jgi:hypothetical protein